MPEWLIWMAAIWFLAGGFGRRRCGRGRDARWRLTAAGDPAPPDRRRGREILSGARDRRVAPPPPETAEARLQREFVQGRLSLEEYESALWRELGPR